MTSDQQTQWEDFSLGYHDYCQKSAEVKHIECQCDLAEEETITSQLIKTDSNAKLYAGIPRETFLTLVDCMRGFAKTKWQMPVEDQLLMTLMKLKRNFLLPTCLIGLVCRTALWARQSSFGLTLAKHFTSLIVWLPRETIKATMPSCFKRYPNTRCILDCAEGEQLENKGRVLQPLQVPQYCKALCFHCSMWTDHAHFQSVQRVCQWQIHCEGKQNFKQVSARRWSHRFHHPRFAVSDPCQVEHSSLFT